MTNLQTLVHLAFSEDDLMDALTSHAKDCIDYDEIAEKVLETCRHEINEIATNIACDLLY